MLDKGQIPQIGQGLANREAWERPKHLHSAGQGCLRILEAHHSPGFAGCV